MVGAYEIDFRILVDGDIRWISARGQGDDADIAERIMFGIFLDVTQRKQAEEANELLAGEMSHRVKNLFADRNRTYPNHIPLGDHKGRYGGRADQSADGTGPRAGHSFVPHEARRYEATLLGDLISILLAPYDEKGASVRIRVSVPKMNVGEGVEHVIGAGYP